MEQEKLTLYEEKLEELGAMLENYMHLQEKITGELVDRARETEKHLGEQVRAAEEKVQELSNNLAKVQEETKATAEILQEKIIAGRVLAGKLGDYAQRIHFLECALAEAEGEVEELGAGRKIKGSALEQLLREAGGKMPLVVRRLDAPKDRGAFFAMVTFNNGKGSGYNFYWDQLGEYATVQDEAVYALYIRQPLAGLIAQKAGAAWGKNFSGPV